MRSSWRQRLRSVRLDRRASAAAEFALVAPLMFTMMLGTIEYGLVFYGYSAVQGAANQTARRIAVNTGDVATVQADLNARLPSWIGPAVVTAQRTNPGDLTKSVISITAVTEAVNATPIKIFTAMIPMTMTTNVSVKAELPFDNEQVDPGGGDDDDDGDDDD